MKLAIESLDRQNIYRIELEDTVDALRKEIEQQKAIIADKDTQIIALLRKHDSINELFKPFLFENTHSGAFSSAKSNCSMRIFNAQRCKAMLSSCNQHIDLK